MDHPYFNPYVGKNYPIGKVLIVSESTYNWLDEDGQVITPQPSHAKDSIAWNIANFGKNKYFTQLNRALSRTYMPTVEQMRQAWDEYAYTIFVQEPVGQGPGARPTRGHWKEAGSHFLALLEKIRPSKVIVTGKDIWGSMPECSHRLLDDLQAYKLSDGELVWCLALPHPANRSEGFNWERIGESIHFFKATGFPAA